MIKCSCLMSPRRWFHAPAKLTLNILYVPAFVLYLPVCFVPISNLNLLRNKRNSSDWQKRSLIQIAKKAGTSFVIQ